MNSIPSLKYLLYNVKNGGSYEAIKKNINYSIHPYHSCN